MSHDLSQPIRTRYPRLENLTVVVVAVAVAVVGIPHSSEHWLAIASKNLFRNKPKMDQSNRIHKARLMTKDNTSTTFVYICVKVQEYFK